MSFVVGWLAAERKAFIHFLRGVLQINPKQRWTPRQVRHRPPPHAWLAVA